MEPVNASCEIWREALGAYAFGEFDDDANALSVHLESCRDCQELARELKETVELLGFVDPSSVDDIRTVPSSLSDRVLGGLALEGTRHRRRRRTMAGVGVAAGAVAAALVLVAVLSGPSNEPASRTLTLRGTPSVSASALLTGEPWGTSLTLRETGQRGGGVYTVSMETATGTWWVAGTYRAVAGSAVNVAMSCAVSIGRITGLRVVNDHGVTVLTSRSPGAGYH